MPTVQRDCYFCRGFVFHNEWAEEVGVHEGHCPELGVPITDADAAIGAMIAELA